jgi:hypothetical protein
VLPRGDIEIRRAAELLGHSSPDELLTFRTSHGSSLLHRTICRGSARSGWNRRRMRHIACTAGCFPAALTARIDLLARPRAPALLRQAQLPRGSQASGPQAGSRRSARLANSAAPAGSASSLKSNDG